MSISLQQLLSKYRSSIMGISIIWVVLYHFGCNDIPVLSDICHNGFLGVDVFIFLSGYGLYHSLVRSEKYVSFYARRFFKLFPLYLLFGIIVSFILLHDNVWTFILKVSTIGFWIGGDSLCYEWFVPSIIVLYLVFPVIYWVLSRSKLWLFAVMMAFSFFAAIIGAICPGTVPFPYYLLVYRIPEFFVGAFTANLFISNKRISWPLIIFLGVAITIVIVFLCPANNLYLFYFGRSFILPFLLLLFGVLSKYIKALEKFFGVLGLMTFEIYLAHFCILKANPNYLSRLQSWLSLLAKLSISLAGGLAAYYIISRPLKKYVKEHCSFNN